MSNVRLKIEYLPIGKLKPYGRNARVHDDDDVNAIAESIEDFDFSDPIGIWGPQNLIVEGHGRLLAAKKAGLKEVPCIRLDHLNEEQQRAYRLAHNKTAELSFWDNKLVKKELMTIGTIDMSAFGFDLPNLLSPEEQEEQHEENAETTQERVENICNLGFGQFPGEGYYDIPRLRPVKKLPKIKQWIGFNYVLSDPEPEGKAVHFFIDDYQFERVWNDPERYVDVLSRYVCVATPDFSPYGDMPLALQIFNHYRKHWLGAFWQSRGITVVPTIRASTDPRSFDWYLDGEPEGGAVVISSMWSGDKEVQPIFEQEYNTMFERLHPNKVFLYGKETIPLQGNIERIPSFAESRWAETDEDAATLGGKKKGKRAQTI